MLSPGFVQVAMELNISPDINEAINKVSEMTAWLILTIGLGLFITNPLAKIIGRRPVYILAILIMFATSIWSASVSGYNSFLASRVVSGIGMAPYEILVQCTITDMYFVHERATRIAVWNLFLLTGISGGALIAGQIIQYDGYKWTFGVCAIFFGILMFGVVFFVPETAYRRDSVIVVPTEESKDGVVHMRLAHENDGEKISEKVSHGSLSGAQEKKKTLVQSLAVFTGTYSHAPTWKIFLRPTILLFYPAVMWGFLVYGKLSVTLSNGCPMLIYLLQGPHSRGLLSSPSSTPASLRVRLTTSASATPASSACRHSF